MGEYYRHARAIRTFSEIVLEQCAARSRPPAPPPPARLTEDGFRVVGDRLEIPHAAHLRELRVTLWRSVEAAREEVLRSFPEGTRVTRPEGGFVLWVQLPERYDGVQVAARAAAAGITILPGAVFSATLQYRDCIRIACGHPAEVMVPAVRRLAPLLQT